MPLPRFQEAAATFRIADEIVVLDYGDGEALAMPLRVFRMQHARAGHALAIYDSRNAEVIPFQPRARKGRA